MHLQLDNEKLDFKDYESVRDGLFNKLIKFINLDRNIDNRRNKGYVEVINDCDSCGYSHNKKNEEYTVFPCDIWKFSILAEEVDDEEVLANDGNYYFKEWLEIMGDDYNWTQEEIRLYRCCNCGKWDIDNDC